MPLRRCFGCYATPLWPPFRLVTAPLRHTPLPTRRCYVIVSSATPFTLMIDCRYVKATLMLITLMPTDCRHRYSAPRSISSYAAAVAACHQHCRHTQHRPRRHHTNICLTSFSATATDIVTTPPVITTIIACLSPSLPSSQPRLASFTPTPLMILLHLLYYYYFSLMP